MSEPPYPYQPGPEPGAPYQGPPGQRPPEPGAPYPGQYQGPQQYQGQQYQGPWQYPQGPYSPYGGAHEHPQGTTILVMGIVSLVGGFLCGLAFLLGPAAWIMGNSAIREIDQNPMAYSNRGAVQGGRICGIIATVIMAIGIVLLLILVSASS